MQSLRKSCAFAYFRGKEGRILQVLSSISRQKSTRIRLYPPLLEETLENMETVVALNLSFDTITWVVVDKNRRLIDWRRNRFFERPTFRYNHLLYQDRLLEAVNNLPDSDIYLIESSNRNTKSLGKVRYLVDSAVIEALVVTLINATKGKPMKRTEREKDSEDHYRDHSFDSFGAESDIRTRLFHHDEDFDMRTRSETDFVYKLTNKVYVFHKKNFQQWSTIKGERISSYPFVTELIREGTGPLTGLEIPHYFHHEILKLSNLQEKEGLARSLLMADLVVRFCSDLSVEEEEEKNKTVNREKGSLYCVCD